MSPPTLTALPNELITLILIELGHASLESLLLAQRVCKLFRELHKLSAELQCLLYFRPRESTGRKIQEYPAEDVAINPMVQTQFKYLFDSSRIVRDLRFGNKMYENYWMKPAFTELPWAATEESREIYLRPEASWRRMLITRLPTKRLRMLRFHKCIIDSRLISEIDVQENIIQADESNETNGQMLPYLTMEQYYDVCVGFRPTTISWYLVCGKTLHDLKYCLDQLAQTKKPMKQMEVLENFPDDPTAIVLMARGTSFCMRPGLPENPDFWQPTVLGKRMEKTRIDKRSVRRR